MNCKLEKAYFWATTIAYFVIVALLFYGSLTTKVIYRKEPIQNVETK
jgi:hypothetical protein